MNPIKPGQIWRQNDGSRQIKVVEVHTLFTSVFIRNCKTGRESNVDLFRFDSKRKNGFTLVRGGNDEQSNPS